MNNFAIFAGQLTISACICIKNMHEYKKEWSNESRKKTDLKIFSSHFTPCFLHRYTTSDVSKLKRRRVSTRTLWKHQKTPAFVMFSRVTGKGIRPENSYSKYFGKLTEKRPCGLTFGKADFSEQFFCWTPDSNILVENWWDTFASPICESECSIKPLIREYGTLIFDTFVFDRQNNLVLKLRDY